MKTPDRGTFAFLAGTAALACIAFSQTAGSAPEAVRFYVTGAASSLVNEGLAAKAPTDSEAAAFQPVPNPGIRFQANEAQATTAPWIDSNAWRFQRGIRKANYTKLPQGSAPLAAAEAFAFHVDAILNPEQADVPELAKFLRFLKTNERPPLPVMANIGIVDDHSPAMDEVLNMLTRRNLLYRVVPARDRQLDITVQLGTKDFPKESADNPSDFAARVRAKLGDDRRLVRLYGATTIIAHLTGDGKPRASLPAELRRQGRPRPGWRRRRTESSNSRARALSALGPRSLRCGGGCEIDRHRKPGQHHGIFPSGLFHLCRHRSGCPALILHRTCHIQPHTEDGVAHHVQRSQILVAE